MARQIVDQIPEWRQERGAPSVSLYERSEKPTYPLPISSGILEHREKIGAAIWLFIQLIDWTTSEENGVGKVLGGKPVKLRELMETLRLKERQIRSQLQRLKAGGYVRLKRNPYGYVIEVLKSKKFINRDRQKVAVLPFPDRHKVADPDRQQTASLNGEIGNYLPERPAIMCRNKEDLTEDLTKKNGASRKKRERADSDPRVKILVTAFVDKYLARVGSAYVVTQGKDPALLKRLLTAGHDVPAIEAAMDSYFANQFHSNRGFDVGGFSRAFNTLNSAGARKRHNYEDGAFPKL